MNIRIVILGTLLLITGCTSIQNAIAPNVIYPCTIGCGNDNITPPKGYVYYGHRVISLQEFNRITGQHIVQQ